MIQNTLFDIEETPIVKTLNVKDLLDIAYNVRQSLSDYEIRDIILALLFYKHTSEKMVNFENKEDALLEIGFYLEQDQRFCEIVNKGTKGISILNDIQTIFCQIDKDISDKEEIGLFNNIDLEFSKLGSEKDKILFQILESLNSIDLSSPDKDVLGDIYEYFNGGKFGEFYTPQQVSKIVSKIVCLGKDTIQSVYDPTCGSGSLLLSVAKETKVENFYGQEINHTTYNLSRMNMIMHNVHYHNFNIKHGDTLENPKHLEFRFEAIVANPPYSVVWSADTKFLKDPRFTEYGVIAPKSKADFAFIQHMVYHLAENGTMAVVLPHGVLFRAKVEGEIRKYLLDKNYIDAVIGLPPNIFMNTSIETCILVLKKNREDKKVLFIDASKDLVKENKKNTILDDQIDNIITTYKERIEKQYYSYVVELDKIIENEYNLNLKRYVETFEEKEEIDLKKTWEEIQILNKEIGEYEVKIAKFLEELGLLP